MSDHTRRLVDESWRAWADEKFASLGEGAQTRCETETGVPQPQISKAVNGKAVTSKHLDAITEWLVSQGFEPPSVSRIDRAARIIDAHDRLTGTELAKKLADFAETLAESVSKP